MLKLSWSGLVAATLIVGATAAQAQGFSFVALGDLPYGAPDKAYGPYRALIERINRLKPSFSLHVGDIKSGSTRCSDEEFSAQLEHFSRYAGAVVYTPGDNEWTDCHRANNGGYDPLERLDALRQRFFDGEKSLGQNPIRLESQARLMPEHGRQVENQRWQQQDVLFATVHLVGSNNNLESRDPRAAAEFFERDAANVAWIRAAFEQAEQRKAKALVLAFQADMLEPRSANEDFPGHSGFRRSVGQTLLPLARQWGKPVLVIHGDSHRFMIDQPFTLDKKPLSNVTRLEVPGAQDVRAVRVEVNGDQFAFELVSP
jgi:hypothetical protein